MVSDEELLEVSLIHKSSEHGYLERSGFRCPSSINLFGWPHQEMKKVVHEGRLYVEKIRKEVGVRLRLD